MFVRLNKSSAQAHECLDGAFRGVSVWFEMPILENPFSAQTQPQTEIVYIFRLIDTTDRPLL